ncbi:myosin xv [Culex quinquefasciatus]|uniref:Myosin xv n=1 Tax=Culex quinquefasciatus TaxID=7176 RepID=B0XJQ7_CULQU|nr:myosin xv [Culex quinquefasciatus]|eukprot:XP_001869879.1 myosin xv [Culex quinquefasciatus]
MYQAWKKSRRFQLDALLEDKSIGYQEELNVLLIPDAQPLLEISFFAVKRVWSEEALPEEVSPMWRELILALNRRGVLFLDPNTHETLQHWPFNEVISTRKVCIPLKLSVHYLIYIYIYILFHSDVFSNVYPKS